LHYVTQIPLYGRRKWRGLWEKVAAGKGRGETEKEREAGGEGKGSGKGNKTIRRLCQ